MERSEDLPDLTEENIMAISLILLSLENKYDILPDENNNLQGGGTKCHVPHQTKRP